VTFTKEWNWRGQDPGEGPYRVYLRVQEPGKDMERKRHIVVMIERLQTADRNKDDSFSSSLFGSTCV
jgi:hypothetical protein